MEKTYDPGAVEPRLYRWWEESGYFQPRGDAGRSSFVIAMPPPNVTGELHLGHALTATMEDIMIRFHRMLGDPTLWIPGSDHAGIATQVVVERMLRDEGIDRHTLGRERFLERIWEWKRLYGSRIQEQHRRLGASCDWSRERFTFDEGLLVAVRETFVRLFEEKLLYRDARIITWCPRCASAISDLEVDHHERPGTLYHVAYTLAEHPGMTIVVATTRPETILGDTGIAVHPDDPRYQDLVGQHAIVPILGRHIPIVADEAVESQFGTGAVKVTPAHDPTDFEIGARHGLPRIQVIGLDAHMTAEAGPYAGLDRDEARARVLADLEGEGSLVRSEEYIVPVSTCNRCGTTVEPLISTQWFVAMKGLAGPAIAAVRYGRTTIIPERFTKMYMEWLTNIHDWCISRQLWWGHRIPAWYCSNGHTTVSREDPSSCSTCGDERLEQDPDVLDTWFSSQLWPFSTLGWPEKTDDLDRFYPTSVMETGYDIIFFWVARMMMAGLHLTGSIPFHTIYLHGLVRDEKGEKMSKSKGNVINPLELMDEFGTDALRFTLATGSTPGQDMKLARSRVEGNRNFVTKVWNAARFVLSYWETDEERPPARRMSLQRGETLSALGATLADRWIVSRLNRLIETVTRLIEERHLGEAGRHVYDFFWGEYCDWYLEMAKIELRTEQEAAREATMTTLLAVLEQALHLLHPYMPFVTEEIYQALPGHGEALILAPWPTAGGRDDEAEKAMNHLIDVVGGIRTARSELVIEPRRRLTAIVVAPTLIHLLEDQRAIIESLAVVQIELRERTETIPAQSLHLPFPELEVYLPLEGVIDMEKEQARTRDEKTRVEKSVAGLRGRLENPAFTDKAPAAVIAKERERLIENEELLDRLRARMQTLGRTDD